MKRGQVELSFGMIFSIILIISFLAFATFAIYQFVSLGNFATANAFASDLSNDVYRVWKSTESTETRTYRVPQAVEKICFVDFLQPKKGIDSALYDELNTAYFGNEDNLFFYPIATGEGVSRNIEHLNLDRITIQNNPSCVRVIDGRVKLSLQNSLKDPLVVVRGI